MATLVTEIYGGNQELKRVLIFDLFPQRGTEAWSKKVGRRGEQEELIRTGASRTNTPLDGSGIDTALDCCIVGYKEQFSDSRPTIKTATPVKYMMVVGDVRLAKLIYKDASATHKLGVLYVIDSITRRWVETTRRVGRPPRSAAPDGTLAAGVDEITKFLPALMTDIISHAPLNQKGKIAKFIDNWEKDDLFPPSMLTSFRKKLSYPLPTSSWNFQTEQRPRILVPEDEGASSVLKTKYGPLPGDASTAAESPALKTSNVVTQSSASAGCIKVLSHTIFVDGVFSDSLDENSSGGMNAREGIKWCRIRGIRFVRWFSEFMSSSYMDISTGISTIPIRHLSNIEHE